MASWLLVTFLSLLAFGSLITQGDEALTPVIRVAGTLVTAAIACCFVVLQEQLLRGWRNHRTTALAVVVVVLGLVNVQLSDTWSLLGISIAAATLAAPIRWSVPLAVVVWMTGTAEVFLAPGSLTARLGVPLTTLLTAVVQFTLTRLAVALGEAHRSQEGLARQRVDTERQRISRDLHDIIGRTLVAASLRNEAAQQLLDHDVERAREQLVQAHETIARGQAQLRSLTSGPVIADLPDELSSASALCARLGIDCRIDGDVDAVTEDDQVAMLAAMVIREAVTNMLRHSSPRHCTIRFGDGGTMTSVVITNDGCTGGAPTGSARRPGSSGTGLAELRSRVEAVGGTFEAGRRHDDRFEVRAELPNRAEPAGVLS